MFGHHPKGSFETVVDIEFIEDSDHMSLDGLAADEDFLADLFIR